MCSSIVLLKGPSRLSDGVTPGLGAANSQAPFEFENRDYESNSYGDDAGDLTYIDAGIYGDLTGIISPGDVIHFRDFLNLTNRFDTVVSVSFLSPVNTIVVDHPSSDPPAGGTGWVFLTEDREDYHVLIEIMEPDNSALQIDKLFVYVPRQDGVLFFDFAPILKGIMEAVDTKLFSYSIRYS